MIVPSVHSACMACSVAAHARLRLPSFHFLLQQFVETLSCVLEDNVFNASCCVHGPLKRASCLSLGVSWVLLCSCCGGCWQWEL
jgi:hypothetical protein